MVDWDRVTWLVLTVFFGACTVGLAIEWNEKRRTEHWASMLVYAWGILLVAAMSLLFLWATVKAS